MSKTLPRAVSIVLEREDGKLLGVSRKHDPNDFGLPGGKVDPGEDEDTAILRELAEETGLSAENVKVVYAGVCKGGSDGVDYFTTTYIGKAKGEIHTTENGIVKWIDKQTLLDGCFADYNKRLFSVLKW